MRANAMTRKGRRSAESMMTDRLRVSRRSTVPVTDPESGVVDYPSVPVYDGRGRLQARDVQGNDTDGPGSAFTVFEVTAQFPVTVDVRTDDWVEVVESTDPLNVGRVFNVSAVPRKTHATAIRASVEEVTP